MTSRTLLILAVALFWIHGPLSASAPFDIGSRLELFVGDFLVDKFEGDVRLRLHKPTAREVVLVTDAAWEGNTCAYYTIFQDGPLYRMYYRGSHFDEATRKPSHPEVACYAESKDGVHWIKPELGLFEFEGSMENNIVWNGVGTHNFTPFKDANPMASPDARYKALARGGGGGFKKGLYAFKSADGIRWQLIEDEPVITQGAFDSQNLAFWDPHRRTYVDFHRNFRDGKRDIMTATSSDFVRWTEPVQLTFTGASREQLYTNAIQSYPRAPHILIGFPTRFHPEHNEQVEPTFMTSRDGLTFRRWSEALIPVTAPQNRDGNRSNYMTWGLVQLPGRDAEYSVYATEAYYTGPHSRVRRFSYRVDGFVSAHGSAEGGFLRTKPLTFQGEKLVVNFATSGNGRVRIELQDAGGQPVEPYTLANCVALRGDSIEQDVTWRGQGNVKSLSGKPVRIRFALTDADLYSFRFVGAGR